MFEPLEGGDELEGDEPLFVPLDVLEKELILADVGVREVELNLQNKKIRMLIEMTYKTAWLLSKMFIRKT